MSITIQRSISAIMQREAQAWGRDQQRAIRKMLSVKSREWNAVQASAMLAVTVQHSGETITQSFPLVGRILDIRPSRRKAKLKRRSSYRIYNRYATRSYYAIARQMLTIVAEEARQAVSQ